MELQSLGTVKHKSLQLMLDDNEADVSLRCPAGLQPVPDKESTVETIENKVSRFDTKNKWVYCEI